MRGKYPRGGRCPHRDASLGDCSGGTEEAIVLTGPREFPMQCKTFMTKSKIPSLDYAINPYLGCEHGCVYCYATFMARFRDIKDEWGSFVGVKKNAPDILRKEILNRRPGVVSLGTVCDAYQPVEERYGITRSCLEAFIDAVPFTEARGDARTLAGGYLRVGLLRAGAAHVHRH